MPRLTPKQMELHLRNTSFTTSVLGNVSSSSRASAATPAAVAKGTQR
eukprot:CAMPEP_0172871352 /NCGR_PEP_ID=MMETSP1075-20121228/92035_1 /TAXON_ID=2916 /ORGANISM="Ceratium fusus, Strain PA161109" /LENGTH=46 /DNA_ID= /DNA_START= /DNA_END= /DNA_ORIENTATION=